MLHDCCFIFVTLCLLNSCVQTRYAEQSRLQRSHSARCRFFQFTYQKGQRCSAANAFLAPLKDNPNLTVRLQSHGIPVLVDAPGVGQSLNDHPDVSLVARANGPYGYYKQDVGWNMIRNGLQFKLLG